MATTYDKASLVMLPSGYKDDKLYSIKPTDGSGDFTFSRDGAGASPATRVNASGLIEKGRENVLLQSNNFNNSPWTLTGLTATSGQADKDGGSDAWKLEATSSVVRLVQANNTSGVQTFSVYAKAGNVDIIRFQTQNGGTDIFFNVNTGSIVSAPDPKIDATIEAAGNGFYRCTLTYNETLNEIRILPQRSAFSVSIGDFIYIQDAQLEQGLISTSYIETTTAPVSAGLLGDMPRLDYSGGASCPSLLLEPSRVNLVTQSEYFGAWIAQSGVSTTANSVTSTEGLQNAYTIQFNDNTASQFFSYASVTSGTIYTTSVFIKYKSGTNRNVRVGVYDSGHKVIIINFATDGTIDSTSTSGTLLDSGYESYGNGWYRVYVVHTGATTGNIEAQINRIGLANTTEEFYIYGAQLESGSYPTSYIPTYGSASTRGADVCFKTGISSLIGQTEGTLFLDFVWGGISATVADSAIFSIGVQEYGTSSIAISNYNGALYARVTNGISADANISFGGMTAGTRYKAAFAYANNDVVFYVNGVNIGNDTSVSIPAVSNVNLQNAFTNAKGVNQALLFKTRLTNAELAALTTI